MAIAQMTSETRLRRWRLAAHLTLEEVADLTGLSLGALSRIERGERRPLPVTRVRIARRLGVSVRELFEVEPFDMSVRARRELP